MSDRINVQDPETGETVGWFTPTKAARYDDGYTYVNGNRAGINSASQWIDEALYLTAEGRWVLNRDETRYNNGRDGFYFIAADDARGWLVRTGEHDDEIVKLFGAPVEEESGPGGRSYTVIGVWSDDVPIAIGVVAGDHPVTAGNAWLGGEGDEILDWFDEGVWATPVQAASPEDAQVAALKVMLDTRDVVNPPVGIVDDLCAVITQPGVNRVGLDVFTYTDGKTGLMMHKQRFTEVGGAPYFDHSAVYVDDQELDELIEVLVKVRDHRNAQKEN